MVRRNGTMCRNISRSIICKNSKNRRSVSYAGPVPSKAIALADVLRPRAEILNEFNGYTWTDENCDFEDISETANPVSELNFAPNSAGAEKFMDDEPTASELNLAEVSCHNQRRLLYRGAKISQVNAFAILQLQRTRHHLTDSCFQDHLKLLSRSLLPPQNNLPTDIRTFEKIMMINSPLRVELMNDKQFVIFDVRVQITEIIERNKDCFIKYKQTMLDPSNFDLNGDIYRKGGVKSINLSLYTDGGEVCKSKNYPVWPILATIRDLPPKVEKARNNFIWLAICTPIGKVDWRQIFEKLRPQLNELLTSGIEINLSRGLREIFKVRFVEFLADSIARSDVLAYKRPASKDSCPICLHPGEYNHALHTTIYPPMRTILRSDWTQAGIRAGQTPITELMDLPDCIGADPMHTTYSGSFPQMFDLLYFSNIDRSTVHNRIFFANLKPIVYKPLEFKRNLRPFAEYKLFKANEWRAITLYYAIALFQGLRFVGSETQREKNAAMIINMFLLSGGMSLLSTTNLTMDKIRFAGRFFRKWHTNLGQAYSERNFTFKAHMHLHYERMSILHGAIVNRTCFAGESMIGFIAKMVRSPQIALAQITKTLIGWRAGALMIENDEFGRGEIEEMLGTKDKFDWVGQYSLELSRYRAIFWDKIRNDMSNSCLLSKGIKIKHFILRSNKFAGNSNDSVFYMANENNPDMLLPAFAEVFIRLAGEELAVCKKFVVIKPISQMLDWIPEARTTDLRNSKDLLMHPTYSFPNYYLVDENLGEELHYIPISLIVCKGFMIKNGGETFIMPLNTFDHD